MTLGHVHRRFPIVVPTCPGLRMTEIETKIGTKIETKIGYDEDNRLGRHVLSNEIHAKTCISTE